MFASSVIELNINQANLCLRYNIYENMDLISLGQDNLQLPTFHDTFPMLLTHSEQLERFLYLLTFQVTYSIQIAWHVQ